jgi:hypothetical protein
MALQPRDAQPRRVRYMTQASDPGARRHARKSPADGDKATFAAINIEAAKMSSTSLAFLTGR